MEGMMNLPRVTFLLLAAAVSPAPFVFGHSICGTPPPECAKYARLLGPLARTKAEWQAAGGITPEARDRTRQEVRNTQGAFITISNGNVYIQSTTEGYETRLYGTLMLLQRAMARFGRKNFPDVEFGIHPDDRPKGDAFFSYCRRKGKVPGNWVWPDFFYYAWPEIGAEPWPALLQRVEAVARAVPFKRRSKKMFWRGSPLSWAPIAPVRQQLVQKFGNRTDVADVAFLPSFNSIRAAMAAANHTNAGASAKLAKLEDICRYKYIIYTEGNSYSGRLKAHLICGSVIITHRLKWESFESLLLEEGRNMLSTDDSWSTLEQVYRRLEGNTTLAQSIAANNDETRRLLDEDGISCYILESLKCFKDVMQYNVTQPPPHQAMPLEYFLLFKMKPGGHLSHLNTAGDKQGVNVLGGAST